MKNYWGIALIASLLLHIAAVGASGMNPFAKIAVQVQEKKKEQKQRIKEIKVTPQIQRERVFAKPDGVVGSQTQSSQQLPMPAFIENYQRKLIMSNESQPSLQKAELFSNAGPTVNITNVSMSDIALLKSNPGYMSYYKMINSKIVKVAHKLYTVKDSGEVRLVFVVSNKGEVLSADAESDNSILKELVLKIVKEASPFPALPNDFQRATVSFSVSLSFAENAAP